MINGLVPLRRETMTLNLGVVHLESESVSLKAQCRLNNIFHLIQPNKTFLSVFISFISFIILTALFHADLINVGHLTVCVFIRS